MMISTHSAIADAIANFLKTSKHGKYVEKIDALSGSVLIEYDDLLDHCASNPETDAILSLLTNKPKDFVDYAKQAIREIYQERYGKEKTTLLDINVQIDKSDLPITVNQAVKSRHLTKLVTVRGMINGESHIKNRILQGVWMCPEGHETQSISRPEICSDSECRRKRNFTLDVDQTKFESYRTIYVKDADFVEYHGDTLVAELTGDLIDSAIVGEVAEFVGFITITTNKNNTSTIMHILMPPLITQIFSKTIQNILHY